MTAATDTFVADAQDVTIAEAAERLSLVFARSGNEHAQPCPVTGGKDRFAFNTQKNKWHCRQCDIGGQDAIGMAAHCLELDLKRREGFLEACSAVLGRPIPEGGERESEEDRAARLARIAARRAKSAAAEADRQRQADDFRDRERRKARGIWEAAMPLRSLPSSPAHVYLRQRGCGMPDGRWLRVASPVTYWHGQDERGMPRDMHSGAAMIAPFIRLVDPAAGRGSGWSSPDSSGAPAQGQPRSGDAAREPEWEIVGCHITWIDIDNPPKFRPQIVDPATGELLPTKKMRGTKKGGLIPLAGGPAARRWVGAEGIENTLAIAGEEDFRADTFYFAAGDLGNLAGPADPRSKFAHPELTTVDKAGRMRPVMVAGPVPRPQKPGEEPDAMVVPGHVDDLVLLADGDSERVMTFAAMARAKARHARPNRRIPVVWPLPGTDFAAMLAGRDEAFDVSSGASDGTPGMSARPAGAAGGEASDTPREADGPDEAFA